jgi:three-Cys-motif partner protein
MNTYWGDDSWRKSAYAKDMFGLDVKTDNEAVASAFSERLKTVAGFAYVPRPLPMRNSKGAIIYYLFFASANRTGDKIVSDIFRSYNRRGIT